MSPVARWGRGWSASAFLWGSFFWNTTVASSERGITTYRTCCLRWNPGDNAEKRLYDVLLPIFPVFRGFCGHYQSRNRIFRGRIQSFEMGKLIRLMFLLLHLPTGEISTLIVFTVLPKSPSVILFKRCIRFNARHSENNEEKN